MPDRFEIPPEVMRHSFYVLHRYGFYFRIRGYGLSINFNSRPLFSERSRYRKKLIRLGRFAIELLRP